MMRKSRILFAAVSLLLAVSLTACTTTMVVQLPENAMVLFNGAGSGAGSDTQDVPVTQAPETQAPTQPVPATDAVPVVSPTAAPDTNTPATQAPASPDTGSSMPSGKAEIVQYYVNAYNKIATDAKGTTRTYDYTSNYDNILNINNNDTLAKLATTLMNKFMVENTEAVAGTAADLPPVGLTKLSIPADKISDATIKDNGSTYEVVLKSTGTKANQEQDLNPGDGSAGLIGPLLRTADVSDAAKGFLTFEGLHAYYHTATVTATIDKASGHITELKYVTPCVLHFDKVTVVVLKVANCDIGLLFQQTWTVQY